LSSHANGLDCLWKAKKTVIVLKIIKGDDLDHLLMPTDSVVSRKAKKTIIVLKKRKRMTMIVSACQQT